MHYLAKVPHPRDGGVCKELLTCLRAGHGGREVRKATWASEGVKQVKS